MEEASVVFAQLLSLHVNNYDKYLSPTVFYAEKTISSVNMKYPHVNSSF